VSPNVIEDGTPVGPILETKVDNVEEANLLLVRNGREMIKEEQTLSRVTSRIPLARVYNSAH
jgi:hypothetical protein